MADASEIILPHGGYPNLIVYKKSDIIYEGTVVFCRRFYPAHGDRTVDQMIQAARSCKQNIVEGSAASGTSKETEVKLTNVARATLDELIQDYLDWLKSHNAPHWQACEEKAKAARKFAIDNSEWEAWKPIFETRPPETLANLMLTLCHQTRYMIDKMIDSQVEDFKKHGGIRERMYAARTANRSEVWDNALYSKLCTAKTPEELNSITEEIKTTLTKTIASIKKKKGWL